MTYKSLSLTTNSGIGIANHPLQWIFIAGIVYQLLSIPGWSFLPAFVGGPISLLMILAGLTAHGLFSEIRKQRNHEPLYRAPLATPSKSRMGLAVLLTLFYVLLYFKAEWLGLGKNGAPNSGLISLYDALSFALKGKSASEWFVYGTLYTVIVLSLGIQFIFKFRHNAYQVWRTLSIMFFQLIFAFLLPEILQSLNQPYVDFKNFWPLQYYFFSDWNLDQWLKGGQLGWFVLIWGCLGFLVVTPILTLLYGKRWYCSWVCGCGGLAETAGDSLRSLSDKSKKAWQWEKMLVYGILGLVIVMTVLSLFTRFTGQLAGLSHTISHWYGFLIGAIFSGIIGVGFYPILGARVWCRYGCPMAAYLGLLQKHFSRFRITTNGGQCISCGNCSTHCEMGIDVKSYAQKGENIVRASCVGCGICSAVCPRGVLKLENK